MKTELVNNTCICNDDNDGSIIFSLTKYDSEEEMLWDAIPVIQALLHNEQIITLQMEDNHILILEHGHNEYRDAWGCSTPRWLSPEEIENLEINRDIEMKEQIKAFAKQIEKEEQEV